jgi:hypothetical protein
MFNDPRFQGIKNLIVLKVSRFEDFKVSIYQGFEFEDSRNKVFMVLRFIGIKISSN